MAEHNDQHKNCNCILNPTVASVHQTLDEMDFEKGIWNAVLYGESQRVEKFITAGKVNARDNTGYTALHYAARTGNEEIFKMLIAGGGDVNATTNGGSSALHRAAMMGHVNIIEILLKHKAKVLLQDDDGQTALHRGAMAPKNNYTICKLLLENSDSEILRNLKDHKNRVAFDLLPADANDEIKKLLEL